MERITLNDLLMVAAARRLRVTVTLTHSLTATIHVDSNDLAQWDEIVSLYGEYVVKEVSPGDDTLYISLTPPLVEGGGRQ